jgi:hypothetical protein
MGDGPNGDVGLLAVWAAGSTGEQTALAGGGAPPRPKAPPTAPKHMRVVPARRLEPWLLGALALLPVVSMLTLVRGSSIMQWNDYWDILPRVANPDGSFNTHGLFTYQNEHPVAVASIVYWLNARLTGGSNVALGTFVVALVAAQVAVLVWALPRQISSVPVRRALFTMAAAALLFAPRGAHNFILAMSGTAWLTANLFAVLTIFVFWRWRPGLALPGAALAAVSYGTGLVTWPMLLVLAILEGKPRRWVVTTAVAAVVAVAAYLTNYTTSDLAPGTDRTPFETMRRACVVLGSPLTDSAEWAAWLGLVMLCVAGFALGLAWRQGLLAQLAPWLALFGYALGGAILIAWSRSGLSWEVALASRYVSLGALAWLATLVLLQAVVSVRHLVGFGAAVVSAAVFMAGQDTIDQIRLSTVYSDETAIALRLGAIPEKRDWRFNRDAASLLPLLDHYPFNDDFTFDCGYLGERLDQSQLVEPVIYGRTRSVTGHLAGYNPSPYDDAVRIEGWVRDEADLVGGIRCVLIIDQFDRVVGAAVLDVPSRDGRERRGNLEEFAGVAREIAPGGTYRAVAVTDDEGPFVVLGGELASPIVSGS